ncbi:MAG: cell division protein ZapA [Bryobacterales bacterium]|nr:cell division protein ZapA [Bryobacterales bacterium]
MSAAADSSKRTYKVRIFQQTYSVVSSASEAEFQAIADHVDQLMHTIASRSGSTDGTRAAVMAAMHLADRLRQAEKRLESMHADQRQALRQVDEQTDHLERLLKETLELEGLSIEEAGPALAAGRRAASVPARAVEPAVRDPEPAVRDPEPAPRARGKAERAPSMPTLFGMEDIPPAGAVTED